jgi:hypothetical protein
MSSSPRWPAAAAILAGLAWAGAVLWRYQEVQSPEPLAAVALIAGWLAVLTLACAGAGAPLWRLAARREAASPAEAVVALALGAGALAAAAGLLGSLGLLRAWALLAVLALLALAGALAALRERRGWRLAVPRGALVPAALVAACAAVTLLTAVTPSPFYDQLHYHLAFPFHWLRDGHLTVYPRHAYSFFPATHSLLYAYALAALGAGAAQAVHWWTGALAVAGIGTLAAAVRGPRAGWWAAAIAAATPSVMLLATWAAADLAVLAFTVAALLAVLLAARDATLAARPVPWLLAGVLVGLAVGCKYLAGVTAAVPVGIAALLVRAPRGGLEAVRRGALVAAGATVAFAPWLVRNAILTGDPVYPFLSGLFAAPLAAHGMADVARVAALIPGSGWEHPTAAQVATLTTFAPVGDAGAIGPAYLALLPVAAWAAWRGRRGLGGALAATACAAVAGWAAGPPTGRYLLPALAPLAALAGAGAQRVLLAAPRPARRWLAGALAAVAVWSALGGTTPLELDRLACTLGRGSADEVMARYASYWPAVRVVNERLPAGARVLLVGESRAMYLDRAVVLDDPFVTPLLATLAETQPSAEAVAAELGRRGVTHLLLNRREAARIAELNGRTEYLAPLSPGGRERVATFFDRCLAPVASAGGVEVLAVTGCAP